MISASNEWKEIMNRPVRNRAFISVGIGIVNQNAQRTGSASGTFAYWSYGDIFNANRANIDYATMEQNYLKADGAMLFMPEDDELKQLEYNGIATESLIGAVRIDFPEVYAIKGITISFGVAYPTAFTIQTAQKTLEYTNDAETFVTSDVLGDTNYIIITPTSMVGGQQRFRIKSILMGVGLNYANAQTKQFSLDESVSSISAELPNKSIDYSFYDEENRFDVDDDNSFIDYLETMQKVTLSFGVELDSGEVEWHQVSTTYLKEWKSQKGVFSISTTDRLSQMEDTYSLGNKIYERTAYQEAVSIFTDAGLEPDEYFIDDYLNDVVLTNPMPEAPHRECLQLLANACRCIIRENEDGRIMLVANFATVIDPDDLIVSTNDSAAWSKPSNIIVGTSVVYADMTQNFLKADGSMYFLPEDSTYLETAYVSDSVSDENGLFETNPQITIELPASYTYFGLNIDFAGNPPQEIVVHTYKSDVLQESVKFEDLTLESVLFHEFSSFDKLVIEVTKAYPNNRVLINKVSFGSLSDYVLTRRNMLENPIGYKEKRVKAVKVKIYTFQNNEEGEPEEVEDSVFFTKTIGEVGETKTLNNSLISTEAHAELVAEWICNYYANNVSYDVKYRGEPRISASDIIHMESEKKSNLQVEVSSHKLSYNGSFSGELELRRALKMMGG